MIRKANINDIDAINNIYKDAKRLLKRSKSTQWQNANGYPNEIDINEDILKEELYVKEINYIIVGTITISFRGEPSYNKIYFGSWLNDESYAVVHRLAVKAEYYGLGIAKELMNFSEELTRSVGIYNIRIDTTKINIPMQRLIKSLDYKETGIIYLDETKSKDVERVAFQKMI